MITMSTSGSSRSSGDDMSRQLESRPRILIVEAEDRVRHLLVAVLSTGEFDIVETSSGSVALALVETWCPDVLLLDVDVPDLDGPTARRLLARRPQTNGIGILLLTCPGNEVGPVRAVTALAEVCLAKPFSIRDLRAVVRGLLGGNVAR
jgi:DNA-binding response OmpR family regulator